MATLLLVIIYIAFISLGIPDSLFGTAWPAIYSELTLPISYGSFVTIIISCGTIISSLLSSRLLARFGTGFICIFSTALTAIALLLFSFSNNFYLLCVCALPLGLGAGAIDIALNNYVALHYSAIHMSFLHCFYGVGVSTSPYILSKIIGSQGNWRIGYQTAASIQFAILLLLIATITLWGKTKISVSSASVRHASALSFRTMVRIPGVKEICCMFITSCGIEYTCGNWCSTFLVENKNMPIASAAQVVMLYYIGLTLGRFCSGLLAVRLHSWKIIRLGQIVLGVGIFLLFMPFLTTSVLGFFLIGFGNGPLFPNLNYLTPENFGENVGTSRVRYSRTMDWGMVTATLSHLFLFCYVGFTFTGKTFSSVKFLAHKNLQGYYNYRNLVTKLFDYTKDMPEQLFLTGSSANGFRHTLIKYFEIEFL